MRYLVTELRYGVIVDNSIMNRREEFCNNENNKILTAVADERIRPFKYTSDFEIEADTVECLENFIILKQNENVVKVVKNEHLVSLEII